MTDIPTIDATDCLSHRIAEAALDLAAFTDTGASLSGGACAALSAQLSAWSAKARFLELAAVGAPATTMKQAAVDVGRTVGALRRIEEDLALTSPVVAERPGKPASAGLRVISGGLA